MTCGWLSLMIGCCCTVNTCGRREKILVEYKQEKYIQETTLSTHQANQKRNFAKITEDITVGDLETNSSSPSHVVN